MKIVFDTKEYLEKAWDIAEQINIDGSIATKLKGAMLYSTLNICDAMQLLIQKSNFVSANILFRSMLEYLFRAYWLNRIASDEEVIETIKEDNWPKTKSLHQLISGKNQLIDLLAREKIKIQDILNSYTHGGAQNPLAQLGSGRHIEPNIPESEVTYLLTMVQLNIYIILFEMAHLSGSNELEIEIMKIMDEVMDVNIIERS